MGLDPVTLGIASAGISAAGALLGGISASNAAKYQAAVARNNSTIAKQNANYAIQAGQVEAERSSLKGAANLANIKAGQAASGIDTHTGSALDVQQSQRLVNRQDTATELNNAQLKSYGYRTQARNFEAQAQLSESAATNDLIGGGLGAAGSLLGNASSLGFKWNPQTTGVSDIEGGLY